MIRPQYLSPLQLAMFLLTAIINICLLLFYEEKENLRTKSKFGVLLYTTTICLIKTKNLFRFHILWI